MRVNHIHTFEQLISRYGQGHGCEVCKPLVASVLASCWNEYLLKPAHLPLQDTNDRYFANIQKDGTYSVVPRMAAGEVTPDGLIAIGQIAKRYQLYSKVTGGQRIDCLARGWNSCRRSGASWPTPGLKPATPMASRCAR